jgi:hypothetical protein
MKMNSSLRKLLAAAAIPLIVNAGIASADNIIMAPIDNPDTKVVQGKDPKITPDGKASFITDVSKLGWLELSAIAASKRTAIIFEGAATPGRQCPYLSERSHEVRQIHPEERIYRTTTKASAQEAKAVNDAKCVISSTISPLQIKPYQPQ